LVQVQALDPSERARAGSLWVSIISPSAPTATAAFDSGGDKAAQSGGVAGVYDNGQVGFLLQ
jgi:hypothetical protein